MIEAFNKEVPNARIYIQSVLPVNHEMSSGYATNEKIRNANAEISRLAKEKGCTFINLYDLYEEGGEMKKELTRDGVHLKPEAYSLWASAIEKYIYEN